MANFNGGSGNDVFPGTGDDDVAFGNGGNDTLSGLAGNDQLNGGASNDILAGGDDNGILIGGAGADTIDGGDDNDTVSYAGAATAVSLTLGIGGAENVGSGGDAAGDKISNVENMVGGNGADTLVGNDLNNIIEGG